jgi:hypothetical protein
LSGCLRRNGSIGRSDLVGSILYIDLLFDNLGIRKCKLP